MVNDNLTIPIIYYHSIAPRRNEKWVRNYLTMESEYFHEQMKFFIENKYKSVFLSEYYEIVRSGNKFKDNYYCLTFDDGYLDNFVYAYPLLKSLGIKATIFVNPEYVDKRNIIRDTLEDCWDNKISRLDLDSSGFLSWPEMKIMQQSGLIDIQSHTLTHTKYFISDKIINYHHPGADCLYPISNIFPEKKPYYISDPEFEKLIPYGYPFFEEKSSVIARKVTINDSFQAELIDLLRDYDWCSNHNSTDIWSIVRDCYTDYKINNNIISGIESEMEYKERVFRELKQSKEIIEKKLNKTVDYLCWPHGDNNQFSHNLALDIGYKATSTGNMPDGNDSLTRFRRFGLGKVRNNLLLTRLKVLYKVKSYQEIEPFNTFKKTYELLRDKY